MTKRRVLSFSVFTLLVVGVIAAGFVFIQSLGPSYSAESSITRRIATDIIQPGESLLIQWLGDPVIFAKDSEGTVSSFVGVSTFRGCVLEYAPPGQLSQEWQGGWFDPCHIGAWDENGKFVPSANSSDELVLDDLQQPNELSWEGTVAVLHR
ncbi:MAG: hypothetical protein RL839_12930 [Gammaproteobacteria bacterium]